MGDATKTKVQVAGLAADRFEGVRNNESASNQKFIIYHFMKDGRLIRIIYTKTNSTAEEEKIFEKVVGSLTF